MNRIVRWILVLTGAISILVAIGFFAQLPWITGIWPYTSGRLSNIFISSILAAIGAPVVWIGLTGEPRKMAGGALNLLVTNAGFAITTYASYTQNQQPSLLVFSLISTFMVILCVGLFIYSHRKPLVQSPAIPTLVRVSFIVFSVTLLATAISLLLKRPNTFPWPLSAENSVMYGWIFMGAMCYFVYALLFPVSSNMRGQLIGFLAYDLILIVPFLMHFADVKPEMLTSLIIYTTVVSYSGLLAIYYLLIDRASYHATSHPAESR